MSCAAQETDSQGCVDPLWILDESEVNDTLLTRQSTHGDFKEGSRIAQDIKCVMRETEQWANLSSDKQSALEMIAFKISRILGGDPMTFDHWHDIAGYAKLVANDLEP